MEKAWKGGNCGCLGSGAGGWGGRGLDGLRPSRAAAWISYFDSCEGSILF